MKIVPLQAQYQEYIQPHIAGFSVPASIKNMYTVLRQKASLLLLDALSHGKQSIQKDIENHFYETTGIFLFRLKDAECRRDQQGHVTMLRLQKPSGQMCFFQ